MNFWRSQWLRLKIRKWLISRRRTPVGPTPQVSVASGKVTIKVFMGVKSIPPSKNLTFSSHFVYLSWPIRLFLLFENLVKHFPLDWRLLELQSAWTTVCGFLRFLSFFFSRMIFVFTLILGSQWPKMKNEIIWLLQNWLANLKCSRASMSGRILILKLSDLIFDFQSWK